MPKSFTASNILKGDMSLVGTRPPTLDEYKQYEIHHKVRLAAKPGLTGLWQVSGRSDIVDFEEVVALDKKYIVRVVYPAGEIHREQLARAAAKLSRVLTDGYGVKIDDAEYAVVFLLKPDPVFERAEIIAYRDLAGRLNARKDPFFRCCVGIHRYLL